MEGVGFEVGEVLNMLPCLVALVIHPSWWAGIWSMSVHRDAVVGALRFLIVTLETRLRLLERSV